MLNVNYNSIPQNGSITKIPVVDVVSSDIKDKFLHHSLKDTFEKNNTTKIIAHRGYDVEAPENTIAAFVEAKKQGYNTIEFDVEWTKDNVPVILHDSIINRTARNTDGSRILSPKKCSSLTYDELSNYDFGIKKGSKFKGTKIPTYTETLDCAKENNLDMYIELKMSKGFDAERAKLLVDEVKSRGLEDKVTWISFSPSYLKMISEQDSSARLGYLKLGSVKNRSLSILKSLQTGSNDVFFNLRPGALNKKGVELMKKAGEYFEAWSVNNQKLLQKMLSWGCKGITTDVIKDNQNDTK